MIFELMTCAKLLYRWAWSSKLGAGRFVKKQHYTEDEII